MKTSRFIRYELIRNFQNRRFFVFTVGFPLILYFLIATPTDVAPMLERVAPATPSSPVASLAVIPSARLSP